MVDPDTTVISAGIRLTGDIAGDGDVEVHGGFEGSIHIGGELRISRDGVAIAEVVAARVRIDGRLEGRVRATQQVAIGEHGCLVGNVQGLLAVEEGGVFKGRVDVDLDPPEPLPPVRRSEPGSQPRRLLRPTSQPILRLPNKERSPTEPSANRAAVGGIGDEHRAARRPARRLQTPSIGAEEQTTRPMPAVPPGGANTAESPAVRRGGASTAESPAVKRRAAQPPPEPPTDPPPEDPPEPISMRRAPKPPTPPEATRRRPRPGDPVRDRADLTDEWFVFDDEELPSTP